MWWTYTNAGQTDIDSDIDVCLHSNVFENRRHMTAPGSIGAHGLTVCVAFSPGLIRITPLKSAALLYGRCWGVWPWRWLKTVFTVQAFPTDRTSVMLLTQSYEYYYIIVCIHFHNPRLNLLSLFQWVKISVNKEENPELTAVWNWFDRTHTVPVAAKARCSCCDSSADRAAAGQILLQNTLLYTQGIPFGMLRVGEGEKYARMNKQGKWREHLSSAACICCMKWKSQ